MVAYLKENVICIVNLDPFEPREGVAILPASLGLPPAFHVRDLLGGRSYRWTLGRNFVRLDPGQAHVFKIETHV
jgi:hypothetical protein